MEFSPVLPNANYPGHELNKAEKIVIKKSQQMLEIRNQEQSKTSNHGVPCASSIIAFQEYVLISLIMTSLTKRRIKLQIAKAK